MKSTAKVIIALSLLKATSGFAAPALLAASATSSSTDSSSLICLIDAKCKGQWSPGSADSGHDEGLYFQFKDALEINYIEVIFAGTEASHNLGVRAYLDGKTTTQKLLVVHSLREPVGQDTRVVIGGREGYGESIVPLASHLKSFFLKLDRWGSGKGKAPTIKKISFYKDFSSGDKLPSLSKPISVDLPILVPAEVTSTSVLSPTFAYHPSHLFDSMADMAWATDGSKSPGVGESVVLRFQEPVGIASMMVWNGYQRSSTHFTANARIASLSVTSDGSQEPQELALKDVSGVQSVILPKMLTNVKILTLKIGKVFPGSKYKDALISELRFLDGAGRVIIPAVEPVKPEVPASLKPIMDRSFSLFLHNVVVGSPEECVDKCMNATIRLRSNGTFVIYKDFDYGGVSAGNNGGAVAANVIEGNWEPKGDGVRIFGKKYTTSLRSSEYLEGPTKAAQAAIFQSDMTFNKYGALTKPERIKILKGIEAQFYTAGKVKNESPTSSLYWSARITNGPSLEYGGTGYKGENEGKLLENTDTDLKARNPWVIKSSVFNGLVLPTDNVGQCFSGC